MSNVSKVKTIDIFCLSQNSYEKDKNLSDKQISFLTNAGFSASAGELLPLANDEGQFEAFAFGLGKQENRPALLSSILAAKLNSLKIKNTQFQLKGEIENSKMAALGFLLGSYDFDKYKNQSSSVLLKPSKQVDINEVKRLSEAAFIARDFINTAPNDLGPNGFEKEIISFANKRKMKINTIVGDDLLKENFPMVHAVGRASEQAPRLIDMVWGNEEHAKITLVGKGVTFDSGGLDIKHAAGMLIMKKDMGGAANVLGLAHAIIDAKLKIRLRVILPVVENSISGNSFRPGDVLKSRAGINVEIGNTDAEGRLILADALALADEEKPEMIIDIATLTGAARVALGTELVPLYCKDKNLAEMLYEAGENWDDPLWPMPLYQPYDRLLSSKIADVNHITQGGYAGSITAALFLQRFIKNTKSWVHLDIYGWSVEARAGRTHGGTDQAIRAVYQVLKDKYGS